MTVLALLFSTGLAAGGYALGLGRGRRTGRAGNGWTNDGDPYRAGYLAGHMAGWQDAVAKAGQPARPPEARSYEAMIHPAQPAPVHTHPIEVQPLAAAAQTQAPSWQVASPPAETPQQAAERKEKRDRQNINVTLYVASLLLVAAGALFVGTNLPGTLRFMAMWAVTVLFYAAGLVLHPRVPRLRPAAMAFTGTGLALVPVTGVAMYSFALHNGPLTWLVTSVLGTIAYVYAAIRLDNKVLAALSLSFVVSTAWSGVSLLGGALVWYFTSLICVAIVLTLAALMHPRWIPPLFIRPLMVLHPFVVPAVALAASLTPNLLGKGEYSLVMMMCGSYLAVMLWVPGGRFRTSYFYAARAAFSLAVIALVWDVSGEPGQALLAAVLCLGIQAVGLAFAGKRLSPKAWWNDAVSCLGLQLVVAIVLTVFLSFGSSELSSYWSFYVVLATSMLLGWKLRGGVAFAPAAVLAASLALMPMLGPWPLFAMFVSTGVFWFGLALRDDGLSRKALVLSGRIAITVSAPALMSAVYPERPDSSALVLLALLVVCAVQQVLSAAFERFRILLLAPQTTALAFGGVGIVALMVLPVLDKAPGRPVVMSGLLAVLTCGLAAGLLAFPRSHSAVKSNQQARIPWRANGMEFLAPAAGSVSAVVGAAAVSRGMGNLALLALAVYFVATALRLPVSLHRQCYWWLARATATVLASSAYLDLSNGGRAVPVAGEVPTLATVLVWILGAQLAVVLAGRARLSLNLRLADAGVLVATMSIAAATAWFPLTISPASHGGWQPGAAAIITAMGALASGVVLRKHPLAWLFAPAALHLLIVRGHNVREIEVLLGLFTTYAGLMAGLSRAIRLRGVYLLAARVFITAFVTVLAADLTASAAAGSITLAGLVLLQIVLQQLTGPRFDDLPLHRETLWGALAIQMLLPCWYLLARDFDGGGRWVVLCELVFAVIGAAFAWRNQRHSTALYIGVVALAAVVVSAGPALVFSSDTWLHRALLSELQVPGVLLGLALVVTALRLVLGNKRTGPAPARQGERWFWFAGALFFAAVAGIFSMDSSRILTGLSVLAVALAFYAASHVEDRPRFYPAAASTTLVGAVTGAEAWLNSLGVTAGVPSAWADLTPWLVGGVGTGAVLYAWRLLGGPSIKEEPWRTYSLAGTAGAGIVATAFLGLVHDETALFGAFLTVVAAVLVVVEAREGKQLAAELGTVVVVAAFQRAVIFGEGARPDWFWAAQWFVVLGGVLACLRYKQGQLTGGQLRLGISSGVLSFSALITVFGGTPSQQIYVLAAHAVLLGAGLLLSERVFVGWGAAGVAVSVMWALRSYAYAMLALLAVALIVLAVWRLNRPRPAGAAGADDSERRPTGSDSVAFKGEEQPWNS